MIYKKYLITIIKEQILSTIEKHSENEILIVNEAQSNAHKKDW